MQQPDSGTGNNNATKIYVSYPEFVNVDFTSGCLHCVTVGCVADITGHTAATISPYDVGNTAYFHMVQVPRCGLNINVESL
jgi:hypothetical protein